MSTAGTPQVPVQRVDPPAMDRQTFRYSLVIPVFNSAEIVGTTIDRVIDVFENEELDFELILVNDGSKDDSWDIIAERARAHPNVTAINLLRNYGQHNANLAGLRATTGDFVITLDDDLQNPPDQALLLIDKAMEGFDVIFGEFERKQAAGYRRLGSRLIATINRRIFHQPPDLEVSNFRIIQRDVVDRICSTRSAYPYITGQALLYSNRRANVSVRHEPRSVGKSSYSLMKIIRLVLTILFSYSLFPLRLAAGLGFVVAGMSFVISAFYLVRGIASGSTVPGWTTLIVLLSLFSGVTILLLSMLGEYVVRTLNTVSDQQTYHITGRVD